jgi:NAD(P)-dependent dehydrogenase (short-subunit alcohol dehydrogenase family)
MLVLANFLGSLNDASKPFSVCYLNRMGDEADLGGAVIFLLNEAARYITGVNLPVDGGFTAK